MKRYVLTRYSGRRLCACFENNICTKLDVIDNESIIGNIYVARVSNIVPNIHGAFVNLSPDFIAYFDYQDNKPIFLNDKKNDKLAVGDRILVKVVREAFGNKRAVVSSDISVRGRYGVCDLSGRIGISSRIEDKAKKEELRSVLKECLSESDSDFGYIVRTVAANADIEEVKAECYHLTKTLKDIITYAKTREQYTVMFETLDLETIFGEDNPERDSEIITDLEDIYDKIISSGYFDNVRLYKDEYELCKLYNFDKWYNMATARLIHLKSGASIVIDHAEAMTVIDVNTGSSRKSDFLKTNIEAMVMIMYQLVLRNISGIIIVDFINMDADDTAKLLEHIELAVKKDKVGTHFVDMTKLALCEFTRRKVKRSLREQL
jgi:ribonuclease G